MFITLYCIALYIVLYHMVFYCRSRSSSGGSSKTLTGLIKRADSNVSTTSRGKVHPQLSAKGSLSRPR